ncbi:hypothetical protein ACFWPU_15265 [Streptomyces sp. NPDC058471]|uniref:hypothetical protein n=1 Tax=Streptomyces sp. NPDC058471 TaxID=3346516 RepID=UPI0036591E77
MSTDSFTLHDSARDPDADIWFAEPAGFTAIPLDTLLAPRDSPAAGELRTALMGLLDTAPDELARQQLIAQLGAGQQLLGSLREVGTAHCSIGLHRDDADDATGGESPGRPLLSLFTLSWRDTATASPAVTAARAVTSAEHHTRIEYVDLPCGPATFSETVRTPMAVGGLTQQLLLQTHAHLPHPDGKRLVVLTLSTTAVHRREEYRTLLRQIAELVSFENPLEGWSGKA